jgi:REP element-mobilizing transposase RayT
MKGYDYSRPGVYFITLCVQGRECLFGEIVDGRMHTNQYGSIVQTEWTKTAEIRRDVILGEFVIMPNHFHGILRIVGDAGGRINNHVGDREKGDRQVAPTGPKTKSVGAIMAGFKSVATKRINTMRDTPGAPVWQRNYFEHIIRDVSVFHILRLFGLSFSVRLPIISMKFQKFPPCFFPILA